MSNFTCTILQSVSNDTWWHHLGHQSYRPSATFSWVGRVWCLAVDFHHKLEFSKHGSSLIFLISLLKPYHHLYAGIRNMPWLVRVHIGVLYRCPLHNNRSSSGRLENTPRGLGEPLWFISQKCQSSATHSLNGLFLYHNMISMNSVYQRTKFWLFGVLSVLSIPQAQGSSFPHWQSGKLPMARHALQSSS